MTKLYRFTASTVISANSEEEAIQQFADNSFDFASKAECNEETEQNIAPESKLTDAEKSLLSCMACSFYANKICDAEKANQPLTAKLHSQDLTIWLNKIKNL